MNNNLNAQILWLKRQKAYEPNAELLQRVLNEKIADKRPRVADPSIGPRSANGSAFGLTRESVLNSSTNAPEKVLEANSPRGVANSRAHSTQRAGLSMSNPDPQINFSTNSQVSDRTISMPATSYVESGSVSSNNVANVSRIRQPSAVSRTAITANEAQPNLVQTQAKLIELLKQQSSLLLQKCTIVESTSLSEDAKRQRLILEVNPTLAQLEIDLKAQECIVEQLSKTKIHISEINTNMGSGHVPSSEPNQTMPRLADAINVNSYTHIEPSLNSKPAHPDLVTVLDDDDLDDEEPVVISQTVLQGSPQKSDSEEDNQRRLRRQKNINYKIPSMEDSFGYRSVESGSQQLAESDDVTMEAELEDSNFLTTVDEIQDDVHSSDRDFIEDGLHNLLDDSEDAEYNSFGNHSNNGKSVEGSPLPTKYVDASTPHIEVIGSSPINSTGRMEERPSQQRTPELDLVAAGKYTDDLEYDSIVDSIQQTSASRSEIFKDPIIESFEFSEPQRSQQPIDGLEDFFTNSDLDDFEDFDAEREYQTQTTNLKDLDDDLKIISEQKLDQENPLKLCVKKEVINVDSLFNEEQESGAEDEDDFSLSEIRISKKRNNGDVASTDTTVQLHPWSSEVHHRLHTVFKLPEFRPNQLDAINATLDGKDVFVLMPTGGGKSLCYQLPAIVNSGKTNGTTLVISPLISLMQDQVEHLLAKNIKACMFSSKGTAEQRRQVFNLFINGLLDLIYISPEMISASEQCKKAIGKLYRDQKLARIVVDEAHCVSNWGHDFRPDYKELKYFKNEYPDIPVMALTATASEQVRMDIVHNLQLNSPVLLKQSFNRTNLFYQVLKKGKNAAFEMCEAIKSRFRNQTGIIYCHSKNSCEQTASLMQKNGVNCAYYHAGMESDERMQVQQAWQSDKIRVICATIAFGMGIDKPDVRFVYHLTVPRTLEGYYQETGRAGRDGSFSYCIMYYSFRDVRTIQTMIQKDKNLDRENKEKHLIKLQQVMQYCENTTDCRRQLVLSYFNENFKAELCRKNCDNCRNSQNTVTEDRDITAEALEIVKLVRSVQDEKVTLIHCQDIYKGSKNFKIVQSGHDRLEFHGQGKNMSKSDIERIFFHLVTTQVLQEYSVMTGRGFASNYVKIGSKAGQLLNHKTKIQMQFIASNEAFSRNSPVPPAVTTSSKSYSADIRRHATSNNCSNISSNETENNVVPFTTARAHLRSFVYEGSDSTTVSQSSASNSRPIILNDKTNILSTQQQADVTHAYQKLKEIANNAARELRFNSFMSIIPESALRKAAILLPTTASEFSTLPNLTENQLKNFKYFKSSLVELRQNRHIAAANQVPSQTGPVSPWFQRDVFQDGLDSREQTEAILNQIRETQMTPSQPAKSVKSTAINTHKRGSSTRGKRMRKKWPSRNYKKN